ncbi:kinesin-like protein KIN-14D isoform X4 [Cajanus cajan]|uniref:kinesin-like protein KIN-14D isoform X3 n=1 Tax=Cajanus cajan TaxID=3821 RepID=UPI0010FB304C|nr:kinesin-like protein KIN-14D isoform X3 [Cajanus cajan]XP_029128148.1 kinesin-like protein KIN-14D isoform X4 [Cajanus cajan]
MSPWKSEVPIVMNSASYDISEPSDLDSPNASSNGNGSFLTFYGEVEAKHRLLLVHWLTSLVPSLYFPINVTDGELRACLSNGTVLCQILNKLRPGTVNVVSEPDNSLPSQSENVKSFLKAMDGMGVPRFEISDLEKGSMKAVVDCLLTLRAKSLRNALGDNISVTNSNTVSPRVNIPPNFHHSPSFSGDQKKSLAGSKLQRVMSTPVMAESPASLIHHVGHKFHEVFQLKPGSYADLPAAKISEMMTSDSLDILMIQTAPTQSLLTVVNGILEESVERRNGEIPHRVACLLKKVTQELERRMSTQAEHLRTQNNLFKAREEKYQSRIRVLEALASGTKDGSEVFPTKFQQFKVKKIKEEQKKLDENAVIRLIKEQENKNLEISAFKIELETAKRTYGLQFSQLEEETKCAKEEFTLKAQEHEHQLQELRNKPFGHSIQVEEIKGQVKTTDEEDKNLEISALKHELETTKKTYEERCSLLEEEYEHRLEEYEHRLEEFRNEAERIEEERKKADEREINRLMKEHEDNKFEISSLKEELETTKETYEVKCSQLEELKNKVKELEVSSESKYQKWKMKMNQLQTVVEFQFSSLQRMKLSWESMKQSVVKEQTAYAEEWERLGANLKPMALAAANYHALLAENKKLFNEIQELKGNIRVYCRVRPFLSEKKEKQSIVEHIGENDLVVANPSKEGKDALRSFKFNRVFGHATTQAEVYSDIQSLIRSVLDGYNVCICAYGQTGSGKTYTMTGPNGATSETIGVNYRALNDLFRISTSRQSFVEYEIGVQMVEIYNEQVRDLLATDGSPKKLGILNQSLPNGLAVPDASLFPVKTPPDVLKLMDIGLKNRAIGATAMNERSSRSHSVVSIHVRGKDSKTGSTMVGNLHLVDLAGSERVDRSEVIGDRLKEAQHINKSLAALGDVIFALSQKSPHVPYRNSKLTQLLQTSLGGQAKTLMFFQINSDVSSYSETLSTLKFAERVAGIELGAARSSKEGKDVRELMEQVSSLKSALLAKDEDIERLQLLKGSNRKRNLIPRSGSSKHFDDHMHQNDFSHQYELSGGEIGKHIAETSGFTDSDFDGRSSDLSDSGIAPGTETDGSENSSITGGTKSSEKMERSKAIRRTVQAMRKLGLAPSITGSQLKDPMKKPSGMKKSVSIGSLRPQKLWK